MVQRPSDCALDIHCIAVDRFAPTRAQLRVIQGAGTLAGTDSSQTLSAATLDPAKKRVSLTVDRRNGAALRRGVTGVPIPLAGRLLR